MVNERSEMEILAHRLRDFASARDWRHLHTPKNLAMALSAEAGELSAEFQWLTPSESAGATIDGDLRDRVKSELADVFIYLVTIADVLGIDLMEVAHAKIDQNEHRFPASGCATSD